jgi:hypothetical protein
MQTLIFSAHGMESPFSENVFLFVSLGASALILSWVASNGQVVTASEWWCAHRLRCRQFRCDELGAILHANAGPGGRDERTGPLPRAQFDPNPPFPPALMKQVNVGEAGENFHHIGKYITHFFRLLYL